MNAQNKAEKRQLNQFELEKDLRERYWKQYKGKLSPKSFSLLWNGKLRKQAVIRLLIDIQTASRKQRRKKT
jgi:hypothetical protein